MTHRCWCWQPQTGVFKIPEAARSFKRFFNTSLWTGVHFNRWSRKTTLIKMSQRVPFRKVTVLSYPVPLFARSQNILESRCWHFHSLLQRPLLYKCQHSGRKVACVLGVIGIGALVSSTLGVLKRNNIFFGKPSNGMKVENDAAANDPLDCSKEENESRSLNCLSVKELFSIPDWNMLQTQCFARLCTVWLPMTQGSTRRENRAGLFYERYALNEGFFPENDTTTTPVPRSYGVGSRHAQIY